MGHRNYYDSGYLLGDPYYRTEVGEFELSDSPYGTFDMGGNVWEWNETLIGSARGLRGGSCSGTDSFLGSSYRYYFDPNYEVYYVGFRVASNVPEPMTMSLFGLGGIAVLRRRKR